MNGNKKTIINIITSGGQVALIGVIYYFLYKYLLNALGVKMLGVWSVVMSTSSLANIADLGIATSMVRYVAIYEHKNNLSRIPQLIFTGIVLNIIIFIPICFIIWPIAYFLLANIIETGYLPIARELLPFSLFCVFLNSLAGVYGSILDGFRKNYIRNSIFSFSSLVFLILTIFSVKLFGLIGVVWAQVIQSFLSLCLCLIFGARLIKHNPFKWRFNKTIFKEIFNYGVKFQLTSLTGMLNEPVTKMLISKFGGLAFAGYYEMANKLVMQIRGVIVSANQSLMPLLVKESVDSTSKRRFSVLSLSFAGVFFFSLIVLSIINIIGTPISKIWIGHNEPIFTNVLLLISICMFINLLSAPTYFNLLSINRLGPIIISQVIVLSINLVFGFIFGYYIGGSGIVLTWMIAVIVGSWYLITALNAKETLSIIKELNLYPICILAIDIITVIASMQNIINVFVILSANISITAFFIWLVYRKVNTEYHV
ncbi:oligosaccharide flippase family protein [uncultured Dysgonomonas sp.]|uniref:oligosaccharide flippase family protein n=1 Tax=uncultured Dysgonomonas sp. TaxID=206096 RepID=UPI0026367540|nr:oligosaccharide flippase family protein [uncultured Dysgonomonas sp.]